MVNYIAYFAHLSKFEAYMKYVVGNSAFKEMSEMSNYTLSDWGSVPYHWTCVLSCLNLRLL